MDDDFFREAASLQLRGRSVCRRGLRPPTRRHHRNLCEDLELICKACEPDDLANRVDVLPL